MSRALNDLRNSVRHTREVRVRHARGGGGGGGSGSNGSNLSECGCVAAISQKLGIPHSEHGCTAVPDNYSVTDTFIFELPDLQYPGLSTISGTLVKLHRHLGTTACEWRSEEFNLTCKDDSETYQWVLTLSASTAIGGQPGASLILTQTDEGYTETDCDYKLYAYCSYFFPTGGGMFRIHTAQCFDWLGCFCVTPNLRKVSTACLVGTSTWYSAYVLECVEACALNGSFDDFVGKKFIVEWDDSASNTCCAGQGAWVGYFTQSIEVDTSGDGLCSLEQYSFRATLRRNDSEALVDRYSGMQLSIVADNESAEMAGCCRGALDDAPGANAAVLGSISDPVDCGAGLTASTGSAAFAGMMEDRGCNGSSEYSQIHPGPSPSTEPFYVPSLIGCSCDDESGQMLGGLWWKVTPLTGDLDIDGDGIDEIHPCPTDAATPCGEWQWLECQSLPTPDCEWDGEQWSIPTLENGEITGATECHLDCQCPDEPPEGSDTTEPAVCTADQGGVWIPLNDADDTSTEPDRNGDYNGETAAGICL